MKDMVHIEAFRRVFLDYFKDDMENAALEGKKSLVIDEEKFGLIEINLANYLLEEPKHAFEFASLALQDIELAAGSLKYLRLKKIEGRDLNISDIRVNHIGKLWQFEGIVRKITSIYPVIIQSAWQCTRCGTIIRKDELESPFRIPSRKLLPPYECYGEQGGCGRKTKMILMKDRCKTMNYQKLEIQENLEDTAQPKSIEVLLFDDIVGKIVPGDRIKVVGILDTDHIWRKGDMVSSSMKYVVIAIYVEHLEKAFEEIELMPDDVKKIEEVARDGEIYKKFISSIAPSLYGMEDIKEAVLLQLFGGVPKHLLDGTRIRGDIHILLVGDPSTAKSQLLRYVRNLSPKGVYSSGRGASAAGLTASVEKSSDFGEGRWVIEAGALVLADMGYACIDELDKMKPTDREAIHTAMEQQIIQIDKAGIHATLKARCPILAACNPKFGRFDEYAPVAEQINLPPELLSRFDLIFAIKDKPDADRDEMMASHILNLHTNDEFLQPAFSKDFIRKYVSYARRHIFPKLDSEAEKKIKQFYLDMRNKANDTIPITPRYLEALIRMAEASARVRLSDVATEEDAERACRIMRKCLENIGMDKTTFDIDLIETGIPKSRKDKARRIYEIIVEIYRETEKPVPKEEIIVRAEEEGINYTTVMDILDMLRRHGEIIEPRHNRFAPAM